MKPSEYLEKNFNKQYLDYKIKLSKSEEKEIMESLNIIDKNIINKIINDRKIKLKELDKRFIDKEELKNKIQTKMMYYILDFDRSDIRPKYIQHSRERYNELEQILKLLEE